MIAMAQAIMKIISKISLTRMNLMVNIMAYNTQIAGKKLFPIDQNMNINHFQGLSTTTFSFVIKWRVTIHPFFNSNYSTKKKLSIQNIRELLFIYWFFIFAYLFSLHIFQNYRHNKCIDMELTYFLQCTSLAKDGRSGTEAICRANSKYSSSSS